MLCPQIKLKTFETIHININLKPQIPYKIYIMNRVYFSLLNTKFNSRKTAYMFRRSRKLSSFNNRGGGPNNYWMAVAFTVGLMTVLRRNEPDPPPIAL